MPFSESVSKFDRFFLDVFSLAPRREQAVCATPVLSRGDECAPGFGRVDDLAFAAIGRWNPPNDELHSANVPTGTPKYSDN